jgi:hypothetical protein
VDEVSRLVLGFHLHRARVTAQGPSTPLQWVAQYLVDLADYNFALMHKPGKLNKADHLLRHLDYDDGKGDNEDIQVLPDTLFAHVIVSLDIEQEVYDQQEKAATQI